MCFQMMVLGQKERPCRISALNLTCLHRSSSLDIRKKGAGSPPSRSTQEEHWKTGICQHHSSGRSLEYLMTLRTEKTAAGEAEESTVAAGKPNTWGQSPSTALSPNQILSIFWISLLEPEPGGMLNPLGYPGTALIWSNSLRATPALHFFME